MPQDNVIEFKKPESFKVIRGVKFINGIEEIRNAA